MTTQTLVAVRPEDVRYIWDVVKPLIDKALHHSAGEMDSSDVLNLINKGTEVLWVGIKDEKIFCAGTTEFIHYPKKKVLRIITFATEPGYYYKLWGDFINTLERFCKQNKCNSIEAWARKGLAKKLKWDNEYSVITKNI